MAEKDLFDDSTMSFGEHLEALRTHLWKAIVGWVLATIVAFYISRPVILEIQKPVVEAMNSVFVTTGVELKATDQTAVDSARSGGAWQSFLRWIGRAPAEEPNETAKQEPPPDPLALSIDSIELLKGLHESDPRAFPEPSPAARSVPVKISLEGTALGRMLSEMRYESLRPRTDGVDEAFMIYLKVSLATGFVLASPWIFYQLWLFVAAGLYPHERHYVYRYFPLSIFLFLAGAAFCFYFVIPVVLKFLFGFNVWLGMRPEVKIGSWIMFAMIVSLMFGLSFQLPLVMVVLDRISLVPARLFREQRRWAILIIAFISMVLTPADPVSMLSMMIPLLILYEVGLVLCGRGSSARSPFEMQSA